MSSQQIDFIADTVGPMMSWPSQLHDLADKIAEFNPRFDRKKFLARATNAWERNYLPKELADEIPY